MVKRWLCNRNPRLSTSSKHIQQELGKPYCTSAQVTEACAKNDASLCDTHPLSLSDAGCESAACLITEWWQTCHGSERLCGMCSKKHGLQYRSEFWGSYNRPIWLACHLVLNANQETEQGKWTWVSDPVQTADQKG